MSLSTEIQRLHDAKDAIRTAIVRRGVQVSSLAKLDDYAGYVDQIQAGTLPSGLSQGEWDDWGRIVSFTTKSNITTIEDRAFYSYPYLTSVSLPSVTSIGSYAFRSCQSITSVSLPSVTSIGSYAFAGCYKIESVSAPNATSIGIDAFGSCRQLKSLYLPSVETISTRAFEYSQLETVELGEDVIGIGSQAFSQNPLVTFICHATTPPNIFDDTFSSSVSNVTFYVPAESVDAYKSATNWSAYTDNIQAIQS